MKWALRRGLPHHKTFGGQLRFDPEAVLAYCLEHGHPVPVSLQSHIERGKRPEPGLVVPKAKEKRGA
ncbi:MAG TPA: hypothetical protein VM487_12940 [Phycisphaerae bacterium]|nr:hypothetical protein [Phycisphaerae bacterium]